MSFYAHTVLKNYTDLIEDALTFLLPADISQRDTNIFMQPAEKSKYRSTNVSKQQDKKSKYVATLTSPNTI